MNYIDQIERLEACPSALDWLREANYATPQEAWAACPRADWMLWLLGRGQFDPHALVRCACDIAETVLIHTPAGDDRPKLAIETARRWLRGEATEAELRSAGDAARRAARAADAAATRWAARAAANAARSAAYAADAAATRWAARAACGAEYAACAAAHDAALAAAYCAAEYAACAAAHDAALAAHAADATAADIVRRHFPHSPSLESA